MFWFILLLLCNFRMILNVFDMLESLIIMWWAWQIHWIWCIKNLRLHCQQVSGSYNLLLWILVIWKSMPGVSLSMERYQLIFLHNIFFIIEYVQFVLFFFKWHFFNQNYNLLYFYVLLRSLVGYLSGRLMCINKCI